MPNEPLALPDILAGLPDEADYDAVYAAVMATERGRRFLTEYAERNRHADTQMLVGAIARVEAALRGEPLPPDVSSGELSEIAAAIDRIAAELAATTPADILAAVERIQDITFVLHERPIEASLCDTLDGAIGEISGALARAEMQAENARKPAERLRALAGRVRAMIVLSAAASPASEPAGTTIEVASEDPDIFEDADNSSAASGAVVLNLAEAANEGFAQAGAEFAASSPVLADTPEPASDTLSEHSVAIAAPFEVAPSDGAGEASDELPSPLPTSENILDQAFSDNHFSRAELPDAAPPSSGKPSDEALSEELTSEGLPQTRSYVRETAVDSEEDPDDLFEPTPASTPLTAATEPQAQPAPPRAASAPRPVPRAAASDPLAAVRALSEEELVALFS
jgi:hypothetical protein